MVTVRLSKGQELILPESLAKTLGLREGDQVEVQRRGDVLQIRRKGGARPPGPLTDLARIVSSSRPIGSVNVERYMDKHGYEQVYGRSGL